jgi:ferric iron reductase protein FhuF
MTAVLSHATAAPPPLFADLFRGDLARFAGKLVAADDPRPAATLSSFLREGGLDAALTNFAATCPGADRRAVASMWSLWYFATLIPPLVIASLLLDRAFDPAIGRTGIALTPDGRASAFVLADGGRPRQAAICRFAPLVTDHLAPLVAAVAPLTGLSPRVLWCNAGNTFDWTQREMAARFPVPDDAARFMASRSLPDGTANPLFDSIRLVREGETSLRRRRICCLRYLLPGQTGCGSLCPLPQVRGGGCR